MWVVLFINDLWNKSNSKQNESLTSLFLYEDDIRARAAKSNITVKSSSKEVLAGF